MYDTNLVLGGKEFTSRLIVGTGKYSSMDVMRDAHEASGTEIITVAVRRVSLPSGESILDYIDTKRFTLLPNTAGCYTADEAVRTCYLAREAGLGEMVKLEVIGDQRTLFPDVMGLLEATRTLARDGFIVMPYSNDDPVMARKLAGRRGGVRDAAGRAHRLGPRHPQSVQHQDHPRGGHRPGHRRRRRGHRLRRGHRDGAGLRRRAHEHGHRRCPRTRCRWPGP